MGEGVTPLDLLKRKQRLQAEVLSKPVADAIAKDRLDICKACYHYKRFTKQCGICHCIMPAKVILSGAACALPHPDFPGEIRKWDAVVIRSAVIPNQETQDESSNRS